MHEPFLYGMAVRCSDQRGFGGGHRPLPHSLRSSLPQEEEKVGLSLCRVDWFVVVCNWPKLLCNRELVVSQFYQLVCNQ